MDTTTQDHRGLWKAMEARRAELGMDQITLAGEAGISAQTYRDLRNPNRKHMTTTIDAVERALEWEPGSIKDVLAGGQPRQRRPQAPSGNLPSGPADDITAYAVMLLEQRADPNAFSQTWRELADRLGDDRMAAVRRRFIDLMEDGSRREKSA